MAEYRGIEIPEDIGANIAFKAIWEKGVDMALDAVLETLGSECKDLRDSSISYFPSEWENGLYDGKERAAEYIEDAVSKYRKS